MRRPLLIGLCAVICGCDPQASQQTAIENAARLAEARVTLDQLARGVRHAKADADAPPYEIYRIEQLEQVAQKMQPVAQSGSPGEKAAALGLIAEANLARARHLTRSAALAWEQQSGRSVRLTTMVDSLRATQALASALSAVDHRRDLAEMRRTEANLLEQQRQLNSAIQALNRKLDALRTEALEYDQQRVEQVAKSDEYARQAFTASGRAAYDLKVKAAEATRAADALAAKAELVAANVDVLNAELQNEQIRLNSVAEQLKLIAEAIKNIEGRARNTTTMAADAGARARQLTDDFFKTFEQFAADQESQVNAVLAEAAEAFDEAVQRLSQKSGSVTDGRDLAEISLGTTRAEYGFGLHKQIIIHSAYRDLLSVLAKGVATVDANRVGPINDAITEATNRVDTAKTTVEDVLRTAAETDLINYAEGGSNDRQRAVLGQLIRIHSTLATITGESTYADEAARYTAQLEALEAQIRAAEQPEPEEAPEPEPASEPAPAPAEPAAEPEN